ncbi:MAG: sensor histidine kinase [Anaerolineae bacterium]|nr:sensor histidine kinase [Anaerolineae bacterium]NUQ03047.1 sensor histidine kinase [Anaerolineae bacterium]
MMAEISEFFRINRIVVLFIYGLTFFVMGFAIFLRTRRHSRLRLAHDLRWLAVFGIAHGVHEWGIIFIPIQAGYLPEALIDLLRSAQLVLLAVSFMCLLMFGAVTLEHRYPMLRPAVVALAGVWSVGYMLGGYLLPTDESWYLLSDVWARYLLGFPGSLIAAYGLRYQARLTIAPLKIDNILNVLRLAGIGLIAYALFGGLIVPPADFPPANVLNYALFDQQIGVPVQVFRTLIGLLLAITIIRALEVFEIELDRLIEHMEVEQIQAAERERIGQEIHDGAIQGVYSASLILESMEPLVQEGSEAERRLLQAKNVLNALNTDLRSYMVSLRDPSPADPLVPSLRQLFGNPRFKGLLDIELTYESSPNFKPVQVRHILAIVQECLSNTLRHARARQVQVQIRRADGVFTLTLEDDGYGFAVETTPAGYGLRSMRDRARLIGGQMEIASQPGKGTKVTLSLPEEKS